MQAQTAPTSPSLPRFNTLTPAPPTKPEARRLSSLQLKSIKIYFENFCPDIEIFENQKDIEATFALRYQAFQEEQGLHTQGDPSKKWAFDGRDKTGIHFGFKQNGEVVGCCRIHLFDQTDAYDRDLFDMDQLERKYGDRIAMASKIVVRKDQRGKEVVRQIAAATYIIALVSECEILLGGCQLPILPFYLRLGFKTLRDPQYIEKIGQICPLIFNLTDPTSWFRKCSTWENILQVYQNSKTTFGLFQLD